jgi:hypothetical protein
LTGNFPFLNKGEAEAWIATQEANGIIFPEASNNIKALYKCICRRAYVTS